MNNYFYPDQLTSERIQTRFLIPEDAKIWKKFLLEPEAIAFFPKVEMSSTERSKHWVDRQLFRYQNNQFGLQALIEKSTGDFIGQCGLLLQEVNGIQELEVGYHIFKEHWGKGFAPEAAKLFIQFAFENSLSNSVISIIRKGNTKSEKVAYKNGLSIDFDTTWLDMPVNIFRIHANYRFQ